MKYLGVTLTQKADELHEANYIKMDKEIRNDLDRWAVLPLDFGSRIETIKMSILPLAPLLVSVFTHSDTRKTVQNMGQKPPKVYMKWS